MRPLRHWRHSQFTFAQWPPRRGDVSTWTLKCPFCCFYQFLFIVNINSAKLIANFLLFSFGLFSRRIRCTIYMLSFYSCISFAYTQSIISRQSIFSWYGVFLSNSKEEKKGDRHKICNWFDLYTSNISYGIFLSFPQSCMSSGHKTEKQKTKTYWNNEILVSVPLFTQNVSI